MKFGYITYFSMILALGAVFGMPCGVDAAVFHLANGGQIEGELLNPQQQPRVAYMIKTTGGGQVMLTESQVDQVVTVSEDVLWYKQNLPQVPNTVEGHWTMAEECRKRRLRPQRQWHLEQILQLDPNHKEARYGLGYSRVDGRWIDTDQWMQDQGYIRYQGEWRIPQDVLLEKSLAEFDKRKKLWLIKIKTWRSWILRPRGREKEALQALKDIDDPAAAAGLIEIVTSESDPLALRRVCIEILGRMQSYQAVSAFIDRAMNDREANIRDACLDQLLHVGTVQAVRDFTARLQSKDNKVVNRAAACLAALREPEATLDLINALVTEHEFKIVSSQGSPGQMNLGFGGGAGGGGNSFGVGGKPKTFKSDIKNENVLNALIATWPGINFGYDEEAWRNWIAERQMPQQPTLRRDD